MIRPFLCAVAAAICARLACAAVALPPEIEDPRCLGINKLPPHATLMPYASLAEALAANRHASSFCLVLTGMWQFSYVPRPDMRPVGFHLPSFDARSWKEIPVPSNWQVQGYGTPYYRNCGYTFQKDWPRVMSEPPKDWTAYDERNPVGCYRREFVLPPAWTGRRVFLSFDGVDSAFFVWINGSNVGYSVNSRNVAEFDVTSFVRTGTNLLAAEVYRYSVGSYLEDQDMWRLSGVFRAVTLWSAPEVHLRDFAVRTEFDAQYCHATLAVTAKIKNYGKDAGSAQSVAARLYDRQGSPVPGAVATARTSAFQPGQEQSVSLSFKVPSPDKWTAETPRLYTTVLTLAAGTNPAPAEIISCRTGFRSIEITNRLFLVNGVPIKLKGANRHENWPDTGHAISEEQMIRDLEVLKQCNCNHVRTCHYSDDPRWYELCDEWGIYLVAEANVECHGYCNVLDREPACEAMIVDRNVANAENFKNHASIVMWSLGNECGGGTNFFSALAAVKAVDPTRPVHYEAFGIGRGNPSDVDSRMYAHVHDVEQIAKDNGYTKPFYLCEYAHAMFNSMGSIGEYNGLFDKYPSLLGGAIWEWEDQGLWNRRDTNHVVIAYGGGFGENPNDHYFIHKGVVFSDRSPKPHYPEAKRAYQWIGIEPVSLEGGTVRIRNKYQFIGLEGFRGAWTVSRDGTVVQHGTMPMPKLAPGADTIVSVPFCKFTPDPGAEYLLRVSFSLAHDERWAKAGYEVAAAQFTLPFAAPAPAADTAAMKPVSLSQDTTTITVKGAGFLVVFSKASGTIATLARDGVNLLAPGGGPSLHLWRAPHKNDDDWAAGDWWHHGLGNMKHTVESMTATQAGRSAARIVAVVKAAGDNGFSAVHAATYTVNGDGSITVENSYTPCGPRFALARVGVRLLLDPRLDTFAYYGRGPMENYADRKRGSDIGLYRGTVRQQMTPYEKPMECGNHEDVRWAALTGSNMPAFVAKSKDASLQVSALPYTDEQMSPVEYKVDLPPSTATVLCLSARTLGAGSAGCGPRPLDEYIVWSDQPVNFTYSLYSQWK